MKIIKTSQSSLSFFNSSKARIWKLKNTQLDVEFDLKNGFLLIFLHLHPEFLFRKQISETILRVNIFFFFLWIAFSSSSIFTEKKNFFLHLRNEMRYRHLDVFFHKIHQMIRIFSWHLHRREAESFKLKHLNIVCFLFERKLTDMWMKHTE